MKKILLFIFLLFPILLFSQLGQEQIITECKYCGFGGLETADIDGDGDIDFLSTLGPNFNVVWHENDGNGQFAPPQAIHTQARGDKKAFDFDGDGAIDILTSFIREEKVAWFKNDGTGSFSSPTTIYESTDFATIITFDV